MRRFDPAEFPGGYRCAGCGRGFREGDEMYPRVVGEVFGEVATGAACVTCEGESQLTLLAGVER